MRTRSTSSIVTCACVSIVLAACGGSQPEAKEPDESAETGHATEKAEKAESHEAKAEKKDDDGDEDDKSSKDDDNKKSDKKGDKKADKGGGDGDKDAPKALRSAQDIVTGKDVLFVFSFNESEPYQAAEKKCADKAKD